MKKLYYICLDGKLWIDAAYIIRIFIVPVLFKVGFESFIFKHKPTFVLGDFSEVD